MPAVLCASISLASLRASSTGCTSELKARLKTPSTRPSIRLSRLRRTLICGSFSRARLALGVAGKPAGILRQQDAVTGREPGAEHRGRGNRAEPQAQRAIGTGRILGKTV